MFDAKNDGVFVGRHDLGVLKGNAPDHLNNVTCETWMLPRNIICISFAVFLSYAFQADNAQETRVEGVDITIPIP